MIAFLAIALPIVGGVVYAIWLARGFRTLSRLERGGAAARDARSDGDDVPERRRAG
jgi:hypothetical protein